MNLWLVCFLLLFFGAEGLQWIGQVSGSSEVDLSWPLIVLGGIGLAIASNYRPLNPPTSVQIKESTRPAPTSAAPAQPLSTATQPPLQTPSPATKDKSSISFKIPKARS